MIGNRTPFRMSFVGGGSDFKEYYSQTPGCVISTSIDKYMYIFCHPFFDNNIQVKYSKTELVSNYNDIRHPVVRECLRKFNINGIDINSIADIPSGTGLGSSSSFTVGLLHCLYAYTNQFVSAERIASEACELEIDILKEPIGKQDQYAASYGGLNIITFYPTGMVNVEPILLDSVFKQTLEQNLILYYLGNTRSASKILSDQKHNIINDQSKVDALSKMVSLVKDMKKVLIESDLDDFGKILHENWELKKSLSNDISSNDINDIYNIGIKNGALGGKVLGAGGGGFILFYCEKKKQKKVNEALKNLKKLDFNFDQGGSKIIYGRDTKRKIWKK